MTTQRLALRALAGGYHLDPDLPIPTADRFGVLGALHVLRHLQRFLESLHMQLVITGRRDSELVWKLGRDYDSNIVDAELRRHRFATSPQAIRNLIRNEPSAVPLFGFSGSSCTGWNDLSWEGVRLDRFLRPGQLIALKIDMAQMRVPKGGFRYELHLLAWQAAFPTHSLVSWGNDAALLDGPQQLNPAHGMAAGYFFHTGALPTSTRAHNTNFTAWRASV